MSKAKTEAARLIVSKIYYMKKLTFAVNKCLDSEILISAFLFFEPH